MSIWIGTASWSHPALVDCGRFYPSISMTAEERLRYYAAQFPLAEVDSSFYAMPVPTVSQHWAARTPEGFVMNVKAFRLFTGHQTSPESLPADIRSALPSALRAKSILYYQDVPPDMRDALWMRFIEGLAPLRAAGRLGLVHFQFAPWVVRNRAGLAHVEHCVDRMSDHTVSVEFRNFSWFNGVNAQETISFERGLRVVHTVVDAPQGFTNSVPALWEVTHESDALVRMHGRNGETWNNRSDTSSGRFNYEYDAAELEGLACQISKLDRAGLRLHVVMNNNAEDYAQANGKLLGQVLVKAGANVEHSKNVAQSCALVAS
jgi:uncharacterized protein YecE (DUF72 family)